jgi:hypothetical protein
VAKCGVIVTLVEDTIHHPTIPAPTPTPTRTPILAATGGLLASVFAYSKNATPSRSSIDKESTDAGAGVEAEAEAEAMKMTAIVHAGADLLLRTAYCPDKFSHRVVLLR